MISLIRRGTVSVPFGTEHHKARDSIPWTAAEARAMGFPFNSPASVAFDFPRLDVVMTTSAGASIAFEFPKLDVRMLGGAAIAFQFPLFDIAMTAAAERTGAIDFDFPRLDVAMAGTTGNVGQVAFDFPRLGIEMSGGAQIAFDFPRLDVAMAGTTGSVGAIALDFPRFDIAASEGARIAFDFPSLDIAMEGTTGGAGAVALSFPLLDFEMSGITGSVATIAFDFPRFGGGNFGTVAFSFPSLDFSPVVSLSIGGTLAYVTNLATGETTRYPSYDFMHIGMIDGRAVGLKADGLYLLEGDDDAGAAIHCAVETDPTDFGNLFVKRVSYAYVGVGAADKVSLEIGNDPDALGLHGPYSKTQGKRRTQLPRGPQGRYMALKIEGDAPDFRIDDLEILVEETTRKV